MTPCRCRAWIASLLGIATAAWLAGSGGGRGGRPQAEASAAPLVQAEAAADVSGQLAFQGMIRTYLLRMPPGHRPERPVPLRIALHGGRGSGAHFREQIRLDAVADREGFAVIYPDANRRRWNDGRFDNPVDDVAFVAALIDHVGAQRAIDSRRVYAVGLSNGGLLAQRLACELPNRIAAIASVAASMAAPVSKRCRPARPVAVMVMNAPTTP